MNRLRLQIWAFLTGRKLCPFCLAIRTRLVTCKTCGVAQCAENCFPLEDQANGQCGCCEYPDG